MTKKELKDIILKTLEKEGGAAGIKALAKAAKTSKNKLKKDLDDMSGVKQHQDGDYISTPINEAETFEGSPEAAEDFCNKCPYGCSEVTSIGNQVIAICQDPPVDIGDEFAASGAIGTGKIVGPKKPMPKQQMATSKCTKDSDCRGTARCVNGFCLENPKSKKPMRGRPMPKAAISGGSKKECEVCSDCGSCKYYACNNGMCIDKGTHPPGDNPTGVKGFTGIKSLKEVKEIIEVMLDEKKKKKKDRCHRKADQVYGTKTSAYKSGAIVKCRKGMIWKKK